MTDSRKMEKNVQRDSIISEVIIYNLYILTRYDPVITTTDQGWSAVCEYEGRLICASGETLGDLIGDFWYLAGGKNEQRH